MISNWIDGWPTSFEDLETIADASGSLDAAWVQVRPRDLLRLTARVQVLSAICERAGIDVNTLFNG